MPLANEVHGASLVPDLSQGINAISQGIMRHKQQKAQEAQQKQISTTIDRLKTADSPGAEEEIFLDMSKLMSPQEVAGVRAIIEKGNEQEIAAFKAKSVEATKFFNMMAGIKDPAQRVKAVRERIQAIQARMPTLNPQEQAEAQAEINKLHELGAKSPGDMDVAIFKGKVTNGTAQQAIAAKEARLKGQAVAEQGRIDRIAKDSFEISQLPAPDQILEIRRRTLEGVQRGENVDHLRQLQEAGVRRSELMQSNINRARKVEDVLKQEQGEKGFTLKEGETRFGPGGEEIANIPAKPEKPAKPQTLIGKARQDLKEGLITKKDFNSLQRAPKGGFKSSVGKLIGDKQRAVDIYGADSEQVKAIQKAIDSDAKGEKPKLSDVAGIRREHTKASQDFIKIRDAGNKINAASANAAGDLSLIFNYMKVLDPGSTVREGEFANAQNAAGVPGRVQNIWNKLKSGEFLNPEQRQQFRLEALKQFDSQLQSQAALDKAFVGIAKRAGINPKDVVVNWSAGINPPAPPNIHTMSDSELEAIANGK